MPRELKRPIRGQNLESTVITLVVANFVALEAIATMGSAGFFLWFMAVNIANVRLARETGSRVWLSRPAALSTGIVLAVLCVELAENPATRNHLWILVGMIPVSLEIAYRGITGRQICLAWKHVGAVQEETGQ